MRQEQHDPRILSPLRVIAHDELVDDRLRYVHEIAELRLPHHERIRRRHAIAVLETEHRDLGQRRVLDLEAARRPRHVLQRRVRLVVLVIVQHRLPVRERPALDVLPGEPDVHTVGEQRRDRKRLGVPPVDLAILGERDAPAFELLGELRERLEVGRPAQHPLVQDDELLRLHRRVDRSRRDRRPLLRRRVRRLVRGARPLVDLLEGLLHLEVDRLHRGVIEQPVRHETGAPDLARRRMRLDPRRLLRLRVRRLVGLIVPPAAVANEVDEEILLEARPIVEREPDDRDARLGVVRVHVDDRHLEALREVARIVRRAPIARIGREADLIVHDDVQRAAGPVSAEVREIECLGDHPFTGEGRVPVHEHREHPRFIAAAGGALQRARRPLEHGIHELEMTRIRHERDRHIAARRRAHGVRAEVVLHVAGVARRLRAVLPVELLKNVGGRLLEHVREHIDAPAVRHADHDILGARRRRARDRGVEHRDEGVGPLDGEALVPLVGPAEETLETVDVRQSTEQCELLFIRERAPHRAPLHLLAEPGALLFLFDVLELEADPRCVERAQMRDRVRRGAVLAESERRPRDHREIALGEAMEGRRQLGGAYGEGGAQRIELDVEMPIVPHRRDEHRRARDLPQKGRVRGRRRAGRRGAAAEPLGHREELPPGILDGIRVAPPLLVLLGDVSVVEDRGDRIGGHTHNLTDWGKLHVAADSGRFAGITSVNTLPSPTEDSRLSCPPRRLASRWEI